MFYFCSYWQRWSRVLTPNHSSGSFIEVNLTPLPNNSSSTWENDVAPIRIRKHFTAYYPGDKFTPELPPEVRAEMVENIGEVLTARLLTEDFFPRVDWGLYQIKDNGGANFEDIKRR